MRHIFLINPNTSRAVFDIMIAAAAPSLPDDVILDGAVAARGATMIVDEKALTEAADEVVRLGVGAASGAAAIIVGAFGDPGVMRLRELVDVPVVGLGEAAFRAAGRCRVPFGVATTTPDLTGPINAAVRRLGLESFFTGTRTPDIDPLVLAAAPREQDALLLEMARQCVRLDHAQCVIIGGGPFSETAGRIAEAMSCTIINPITAAVREAVAMLSPD
ncbi:aspartate/glutamate racemase family protein [Acetobacter fallax]|uniref:Aspartate/glutamate racemase family protein n=1 Tax=Acetobacter fallax TaxID=1737473 RepID=A0ABX0KCW6_9PROT|nr:aspartate/glutamate racemase family protein [Acetobacter fallax]NHO32340.1 aspartate/glutamate racemase family protein [Acetobacter fallax]NHO35899.1 aspartate/glutamate racemase family protein [Acetobacter fallax]